jgi:Predicted phosphohydrolases
VISGNHEYIFGYSTWMAHFAALGLLSLENRHIVLDRNGSKLVLAGITDRASRRTGHPVRDLAAVLEGAPEGVAVILLDHQPSDARHAAKLGVALQLSGHTHGGLILGLDRLAARANAGYVSGRYDVDGMTLYVNNGTALWPGFALRLGRPSELTRITLAKRDLVRFRLQNPVAAAKFLTAGLSVCYDHGSPGPPNTDPDAEFSIPCLEGRHGAAHPSPRSGGRRRRGNVVAGALKSRI